MTATKHDRSWLMAAYRKMGKNFMTNRVISKRLLTRKNTVVELSAGTGFSHEPIYGVTVLIFDDEGERIHPVSDLSKMFHSYQAALEYYRQCV